MDVLSGGIRFSLKHRMIFMFITVALTLTFVMGFVGISLYFKNARQEKTMVAESAAKFAAELVDPDMVDDYIRNGETGGSRFCRLTAQRCRSDDKHPTPRRRDTDVHRERIWGLRDLYQKFRIHGKNMHDIPPRKAERRNKNDY